MTLKTKPEMLDWFPDLQLNFLFVVCALGTNVQRLRFLNCAHIFATGSRKNQVVFGKEEKLSKYLMANQCFYSFIEFAKPNI